MTKLWVIESTYLKPAPEIAAATPDHRAWLDQHYKSGAFLTSGRKIDNTGGIIIAQAESITELLTIFDSDPFNRNGVAEYKYTAFNPVKRGKALDLPGVDLVE